MDSGGWVCLYWYIFSFFPSFCRGTLGFLFRTFVPSRTFIPFCSSKFRPLTCIWLRLPCLVFMRSFVSVHIWGQTWPPPSAPYLVGSFCPLFRVDHPSWVLPLCRGLSFSVLPLHKATSSAQYGHESPRPSCWASYQVRYLSNALALSSHSISGTWFLSFKSELCL